MANPTRDPQDRTHDRCGVSGGAIAVNGSTGREQTASDFHDRGRHEPSSASCCELVLPSYKPSCSSTRIYCSPKRYSDLDADSHSLTSQDSGIPTLEISRPDFLIWNHQQPGDKAFILDSSQDTPATLPLNDDPSDNNAIRKSSTFPRSNYDSIRLFSPTSRLSNPTGLVVGGGALNHSDVISMCSVSSLSTELSVSNENILDFTVTSDSSAIVTLETDDSGTAEFSDVTLSSSPGNHRHLRNHPGSVFMQQGDRRQKKPGAFGGFFNRSLFARKVNDSRPVEPRDPGWKLFGKIPPREGSSKDPKQTQKE
ncbi:TBC1 domain family member 14-like [Xenentodon cancila]